MINTFPKANTTQRPNQAVTPRLTPAQLGREGQNFGAFIVTAKPGFNISGRHKFNMVKRGDSILAEYCRVCSQARSILNIAGRQVDYVQEALAEQGGQHVDAFNAATFKEQFSSLLISKYNKYQNQ